MANLSPEEQATRDRLFWAAFIWDKWAHIIVAEGVILNCRTLSLALGREPTFAPRPDGDPSTIPDFGNDEEPWIPYFAHPLNCPPSLQGYIYPRTSRGLAFRLLARLCVVSQTSTRMLVADNARSSTTSSWVCTAVKVATACDISGRRS